ncbi:MAG: hypothetical protein BGO96_10420 [Micrococcales bacterium 73-15]|uniref:sensor histidine kinase n=1 Tax=Salana multivorans TaxID=120377 RepID=UPI000961AF15|nr:histidine kinase [Salana multivorans]OJX93376.1 MAG: hypothetical protein BGO96_10420 [Micrococcales bacterium 73-15]
MPEMTTTGDAPAGELAVPRWLARAWSSLVRDPLGGLAWVLAVGAAAVTLSRAVPSGVVTCDQDACGPPLAIPYPLDASAAVAGLLGPTAAEVLVGVWNPLGLVLGLVGLVLAARGSRWSILAAAVPLLSVVVLGQLVLAHVVALAGVCVVLAVRDWLGALVAGALALFALLLVAPWLPTVSAATWGPYPLPFGTVVVIALLTVAAAALAAALGAWWRSVEATRAAGRALRHAVAAEVDAAELEARTLERARLARDLHDVVAHHLSLVAVRAESAPYAYPGLDPAARDVLAAVAEDARSALTELRQVLAVLQRVEGEDAPREPQVGADDVDGLVAGARDAGQDVLDTGAWGRVDDAEGYALYRCVQEALTNARRHAPGSPVRIRRGRVGRELLLEVTNALVDAAAQADPADPMAADHPREARPGRGLAGMRERVESLGGTLGHGPAEQRGVTVFRLVVELPVDRDDAEPAS